MPPPGDASTMAGIRYELVWTVDQMIRVMAGEADLIRLQPPGHEGEGVEFYVTTPTGIEYHQSKRQVTGQGKWSLGELAKRRVLGHFYEKLNDQDATCVFVSGHAADTLDELANNARSAESWNEYKQEFLSSSTWDHFFSRLKGYWTKSSEEDIYARLKRVWVRVIDEDLLRKLVQSRLETLIDGDPPTVLAVLKDFASSQTHRTLTAADIWAHLKTHGFERRDWVFNTTFADLIAESTQTYRAGTGQIGIAQEVVPKNEVGEILNIFDGNDDAGRKCVLVTGKAGVGKSSVISQALDAIDVRGWLILALRVDRLDPVLTPREMGQQMGLSASPVSVLAGVGDGQPCLLVVDQLDAVSLASGRNPEFFDCIAAMLEEAGRFPNIKVLAACRKFDVENDHRLRNLVNDGGMAKEVVVEEFNEETVKSVVSNLGLDAAKLTPKQISLLSLPIHLRLLADVVEDTTTDALGFQTAKDLYDAFWIHKRRVLPSHINPADAQDAVDVIAEKMAERESLSIPNALLDHFSKTVDVLTSENILITDGIKVTFFHEGFFDYIFARRIVANNVDLVPYILDTDQSLFIRSQIRQIMLHLRDYSPEQAVQTADAIFHHADIRIHLKMIVLSLFGSLEDPSEDEWHVIESLLSSELAPHTCRAIRGSSKWFDLLDELGVLIQWLQSNDSEKISRIIWLIDSVKAERSERIAALMSPYIGRSSEWDQRILRVIGYPDVTLSRPFFDFALQSIAAGLFDDLLSRSGQGGAPWDLVRRAQQVEPKWACELVASFCERLLAFAQQSGNVNPFSAYEYDFNKEVLVRIAKTAPASFVEHLLPFLLKVLDLNVRRGDAPLWEDSIWSFVIVGTEYRLDIAFLTAMEDAMRELAVQDPTLFRHYARTLRDTEFATAHRLLVCGYAAGGECYADEAVEYLLEGPDGKFNFGYSNSAHWLSIELLKSLTPNCTSDNLRQLEKRILDYYPSYELEAHFRDLRGLAQFELLSGFQEENLSENGRLKFQELGRKFKGVSVKAPEGVVAYEVGSPIPSSSTRKMSDDDWLSAMNRYSIDWRSDSRDPTKGGAVQLSRQLETLSREDPVRFANLAHRIPDATNPIYLGAILQGITDSCLGLYSVVDVCLRCHRLPERPLGRWITRPLIHFPDDILPDEALQIVAWYARQDSDPDPVDEPSFRTIYVGGQKQIEYEPISVGIKLCERDCIWVSGKAHLPE